MSRSDTLDACRGNAKRGSAMHALAACAWLSVGLTVSPPACAQYGCLVLLCLAAPNWRSIPQCVPPIHQLLHDLAYGRAFPTCPMAGSQNSASTQWAAAPGNCPPQYTQVFDGESGPVYSCDYSGAISVTIGGSPWARTWWSFDGDTVTEFMPAAKARLGTWDTRFDDDYAAWLAMQPPPADCRDC